MEAATTTWEQLSLAVFQQDFIYNNKQWVRFGPQIADLYLMVRLSLNFSLSFTYNLINIFALKFRYSNINSPIYFGPNIEV